MTTRVRIAAQAFVDNDGDGILKAMRFYERMGSWFLLATLRNIVIILAVFLVSCLVTYYYDPLVGFALSSTVAAGTTVLAWCAAKFLEFSARVRVVATLLEVQQRRISTGFGIGD